MVYCCVCGLALCGIYYPETFDLDDDEKAVLYDQEKLSEAQLEWTQHGFCTINEKSFENLKESRLSDLSLTSFTTLSGTEIPIRQADPTFQSDDPFPDITSAESFFPIHFRCLTLVENTIKHQVGTNSNTEISGIAAIRYFYQILERLKPLLRENQERITGKGVEWAHGYYGARRFWFDSWTMERGWEFLCADPFDIPDLTDFLLNNLVEIRVPEGNLFQETPKSKGVSLDILPTEIIDKIISSLPTTSILCLHRTCRKLSNQVRLDQPFWKDRLIAGSIVPFLWDINGAACLEKDKSVTKSMCWDWKRLARTLREEPFVELVLKDVLSQPAVPGLGLHHLNYLNEMSCSARKGLNGNPPLGLINRFRIIRIIKEATLLSGEKIHMK
ncbi:hypothetical protein HYFRA_00010595 [Hymenoscyphus fraxineus]|uniref:F-box domain-containing protein n=1 Tax=Hymenoscyphus fraxineus TaxID=746836 RepID=A0A9N9L4V9_9HELO|nr:hypothetical protein HYFRA_00010595 [Hymenoscyphus fraxineus]